MRAHLARQEYMVVDFGPIMMDTESSKARKLSTISYETRHC